MNKLKSLVYGSSDQLATNYELNKETNQELNKDMNILQHILHLRT